MKDEEINVAIAEHFGWRFRGDAEFDAFTQGWVTPEQFACPPGSDLSNLDASPLVTKRAIPNYCNDLNAMHGAEKSLSDEVRMNYQHELSRVLIRTFDENTWLVSATARQRAEAFLRTVGKRKEGE